MKVYVRYFGQHDSYHQIGFDVAIGTTPATFTALDKLGWVSASSSVLVACPDNTINPVTGLEYEDPYEWVSDYEDPELYDEDGRALYWYERPTYLYFAGKSPSDYAGQVKDLLQEGKLLLTSVCFPNVKAPHWERSDATKPSIYGYDSQDESTEEDLIIEERFSYVTLTFFVDRRENSTETHCVVLLTD